MSASFLTRVLAAFPPSHFCERPWVGHLPLQAPGYQLFLKEIPSSGLSTMEGTAMWEPRHDTN